LLGFFSVFNSDAIKDIQIYKSGMPASYGGRLSSVRMYTEMMAIIRNSALMAGLV